MRIGQEFTHPHSGHIWRVTDVGSRTFLAINTTESSLVTMTPDGRKTERVVDPTAEGLLNGPPYFVAESVWDEYDQEALVDVPGLEWVDSKSA